MINQNSSISAKKKTLLTICLIYTGYFILYLFLQKTCHHLTSFCSFVALASGFIIALTVVGFPLLAVLPLSLLTYKMDDRIFKIWYAFTLVAIPAISVLLCILVLSPDGGGLGVVSGEGFAIVAGIALPIFYFLISLVLIFFRWLLIHKKMAKK